MCEAELDELRRRPVLVERRQSVRAEEADLEHLVVVVAWFAGDQLAQEGRLVRVPPVRAVPAALAVVQRDELRRPHREARLLLALANRGLGRRVAGVGPAAREGPEAGDTLSH